MEPIVEGYTTHIWEKVIDQQQLRHDATDSLKCLRRITHPDDTVRRQERNTRHEHISYGSIILNDQNGFLNPFACLCTILKHAYLPSITNIHYREYNIITLDILQEMSKEKDSIFGHFVRNVHLP